VAQSLAGPTSPPLSGGRRGKERVRAKRGSSDWRRGARRAPPTRIDSMQSSVWEPRFGVFLAVAGQVDAYVFLELDGQAAIDDEGVAGDEGGFV
jgi:hypothetical protein